MMQRACCPLDSDSDSTSPGLRNRNTVSLNEDLVGSLHVHEEKKPLSPSNSGQTASLDTPADDEEESLAWACMGPVDVIRWVVGTIVIAAEWR